MQCNPDCEKDYLDRVTKMIASEARDLSAKIDAQSLSSSEKNKLKIDVIKILLND